MPEFKKAWDPKYKGTPGQKWDKEKITIKRAGKEINIYDYIQSNKGDSDIKECLEKYGTLQPIQINTQEVYGEIEKAITLKDSLENEVKLKEIYNNLPTEIKDQFGNNFYRFKDEGLQYFEKRLNDEKQRNNNAPIPTDKTSTGEQTQPNETK